MNVKRNCLKCKGRLWCGLSYCPVVKKAEAAFGVVKKIDVEFSGSAPSVFVGHVGYPQVNVGILSTPEKDSDIFDAPRQWSSLNFDISKIIELRSGLVNSRFTANVKETNIFLETSKEIAMASKPVDLDVFLKDKPKFRISFRRNEAPMGPSAKLEKVQLNENPRINKKVDYVVSDNGFKANDAIFYLYEHGFDENFLSRLLCIGNVGMKMQRKLVPTRWAITATDDILAKRIIYEINEFNLISNYLLYFGSYLGNYYLVLMLPEIWSYELFEAYMPKASWNINDSVEFVTDYEDFNGRKNYAENCAGGYYSVRLAVLEKLRAMKRSASVLALRFVTDEYAAPLGVWVTREATRKALSSTPMEFDSLEQLLAYAKAIVKSKWKYDLENMLRQSIILKNLRFQKRLNSFF